MTAGTRVCSRFIDDAEGTGFDVLMGSSRSRGDVSALQRMRSSATAAIDACDSSTAYGRDGDACDSSSRDIRPLVAIGIARRTADARVDEKRTTWHFLCNVQDR